MDRHPVVQSALRSGQPVLSGVYLARPRSPRVAVAVPILREGVLLGAVAAAADIGPLRDLLVLYSPAAGARLTLTDDTDRVIASTVPELPTTAAYATSGELRELGGGHYQRLTEEPGQPAITRWRESLYGTFLGLPPWHLVIEMPVAPVQAFLQQRYVQGFGLIFGVCLLALVLGAAVAAGLSRPLSRLAEASTDLPGRLAAGELRPWPRSRVAEFDSLVRNFRSMARALEARFQELTGARDALAQRSAELAAANRDLRSEVAERARAEAALRLLAEAGSALAASLDPGTTLERTARCCVPGLADWAVVSLDGAEPGERRYAICHRDDAVETRLREVAEESSGAVLLAGSLLEEPLLLGDPLDWTMTSGDALGRLLRETSAGSVLLVPLRARRKTLGTLALVRAPGAAVYDAATVPLAEELARRAALALDNARLFDAVREGDRRKDEFLAMLAHELRNPLSPMTTSLALLRSGGEKETIQRALSVMERQLGHVVRLVDDLLDVARITRGKIELHPEPLDLAQAAAQTAENLRSRFTERAQTLRVTLPDVPLPARADATRIDQVIANLLANANKYTPVGGHIELLVERHAGQGVVRVRDDGMGMPPELLGRVFDLFMQSEQALDRSQGGLGIGLTLVRQLIEMHGGTVQARSEGPGCGSEFEVRLPLDFSVVAAPRAPVVEVPRREASARRVLVVDDNVEGAESLSELLRLWGHEVEMAHDGPTGLSLAAGWRPEVVLLDIGLPGLDGYEVARRLRGTETTRAAVLIAVTGYGEQVHEGRLEQVGFDHLLVKPVNIPDLRELLGAVDAARVD
jgi:signal transduction histidine kinase/ActR/RegA family two-component response regulator